MPRFQALAERAQGTETGASALIWIVENAQFASMQQPARQALARLTTAYLRSPLLEEAALKLLPISWSIGKREARRAWRNGIEGSNHGPIATRWNVHGWPTIYILDAGGIIRYRGLRGREMEEAVLTLLGETKARR